MTDARRPWLVALSLCASIAAGCGQSVGTHDGGVDGYFGPSGDAGSADAAPDAPFMTADHEPFPQVMNAGGRTLAHVRLITMSFPDYPYRQQVEAFGRWIVTSDWYTTVGQDYGVGAGTYVEHVDLTDAPPTSITDAEIQQYLVDKIGDGTLPAPASADDDVLYMIFYPMATNITLQGAQSCEAFGGYHDAVRRTNLHFSYAVLPVCLSFYGDLTDIGSVEVAASHELIEAATDADPLTRPAYQLTDQTDPWTLIGGEVGDLCVNEFVDEGDFEVQRVWSNTAAAAGGSPCIPADTTHPYFNVSASPNATQEVSAGDSVTFTLTGWSNYPVADWNLTVRPYQGNFNPSTSLSTGTMNNGRTATLTVSIPSTARSGSYASLIVHSTPRTGISHAEHVWPVAVYVP